MPRKRGLAACNSKINDSWNNHASSSRNHRESAISPSRQVTIHKFALYLQANEQKEYRHKSIVDPKMYCHWPKLGRQFWADYRMDEMGVIFRKN